MRQRVEDLGRIAEKLGYLLLDHPHDKYWRRPKDAGETFFSKTPDEQRNLIYDIAYALQAIENMILECQEIALGRDSVNTPEFCSKCEKFLD